MRWIIRPKSMKNLTLALLPLLFSAACSSGAGTAKDEPVPTIETKGPDEVVLRVETGGGFVPVEVNLADLPEFSLYGDGSVITQGPQILIYPGPSLPNLLVRRVSAEGVAEILKAAQKGGLTGPDRNFDQATNIVTDMPTTTFTLSTDAGTHETSAYAFEFLREVKDLSEKDREAIEALYRFNTFLQDLQTQLPEGSVGQEESYKPAQMRVYAAERAAEQSEQAPEQPAEELPQQPVEWPLAQPLSEFGQPSQPENYRCGVVEGADLDKLLVAAEKANQLSPWTSAGKTYTVVLRPLLPDESGC
jgi:hypothetical protein